MSKPVVAVLGAGSLYMLRDHPMRSTPASAVPASAPGDTASARLAIRGMRCGSCATTARLALQRVAGVYRAHISYDSASAECGSPISEQVSGQREGNDGKI